MKYIKFILYKIKKQIKKYPFLHKYTKEILSRYFKLDYPSSTGLEINKIKKILESGRWNMSDGYYHKELEENIAQFTGGKYAAVVSSGGVGLQIALRALGVRKNHQVVHQVDTCVASAFSVFNSGGTPVFCDTSNENFMLDKDYLKKLINKNTKVIMPTHMWGNPENMNEILKIANDNKLYTLEDGCLSFGAEWEGKKIGTYGDAGVFSFGSSKPIQSGEGGVIITDDESLIKEIKTLRNWGDMSFEYGIRDQKSLAFNGRLPEIVCAVMLEQLKYYPILLKKINENIKIFNKELNCKNSLSIIDAGSRGKSVYTNIVLKICNKNLKNEFKNYLEKNGIQTWWANFEPITNLSFFKNDIWREWYNGNDYDFINSNYKSNFHNARKIYDEYGLGISRKYILEEISTQKLIKLINNFFDK
jgi:perosamine synthetase